MSSGKDDFLFLLMKITNSYRDNDISQLKKWRHSIEGGPAEPVRSGKRSQKSKVSPEKVSADLRIFDDFDSREAAKNFLVKEYESKSQIAPMLRALRIPVMKSQSYEEMVERVIDATVGFRLRSAAVRGTSR